MQEQAEPSESNAGDERLVGIVESVLFASGEPIALKRLVEILDGPAPAEVRAALQLLGERLDGAAHGMRLTEVAGGYQLRTARENAEWVRAVFRDKPRRLGRAALETLAVIAYRQPVTRVDIEAIRGVDIEAVLSTLLQRNLVQVVGRKEAVGRPILYGTTTAFLELFGFRDLSEIPALKELPEPEAAPLEAAAQEVGPDEASAQPSVAADEGAGGQAAEAAGAGAVGGEAATTEAAGTEAAGADAAESADQEPSDEPVE